MNNKKKKMAIRIMAIVLLVLMVASCIVPYVAAAEMPAESEPMVTDSENGFSADDLSLDNVTAEDLEILEQVPDEMINEYMETAINGGNVEDSVNNIVNYLEMTQNAETQAEEKFDGPVVKIAALPVSMDNPEFTVFIGNLDSHETSIYELTIYNDYTAELGLSDGRYVVFSNKIAWENADGQAYAINGGESIFFTIGNVDTSAYNGLSFIDIGNELSLRFDVVTGDDSYQVIKGGSKLLISQEDVEFPGEVLEEIESVDEETIVPEGEIFDGTQLVEDENEDDRSTSGKMVSAIGSIVLKFLKDSWLLLLLLVGFGIAYKLVLLKKEKELERKLEEDLYDGKHIE